MKISQTEVNICMITDDNYIMPTSVAMHSMIVNKNSEQYNFYIITSNLSEESEKTFKNFESEDVSVSIIREDAQKRFEGFHTFSNDSICVASISALLKFIIPDLLPNLDKVLYLDGDLIVEKDLSELYSTELGENYAATVLDVSKVYWKSEFNSSVENYFNSGVMLLNLKKMREDNVKDTLIETKRNLTDTSLMDQNVFNIVFDKKTVMLPVKYNFQSISLDNSGSKWEVDDIEKHYKTKYETKADVFSDAEIIHFASKNKPWKDPNAALAYKWRRYYLSLYPEMKSERAEKYGISVIIPCYNAEKYIEETLESILSQSFQDFEIILINDGSTDGTKDIIDRYAEKYGNISAYHQTNHGQGYERNFGVKKAQGRYIHFMDSDDLLEPDCYEKAYAYANENDADLILFEAKSFFENEELEMKMPQYKYCYTRKSAYPKIYGGKELFVLMRSIAGIMVSPCLQLAKRDLLVNKNIEFPALKMMEDNLYVYQALTRAERVIVLHNAFYKRRVRENSTMTAYKEKEAVKAIAYTIHEFIKDYESSSESFDYSTAIFEHIIMFCKDLKRYYSNLCQKQGKDNCLDELGDMKNIVSLCLFIADNSEHKDMRIFTTIQYRELHYKLLKAYRDKSEINAKLLKTYKEKSEANAKLQQAYKEKSAKTKEIKRLEKYSLYPFLKKIKNAVKKH